MNFGDEIELLTPGRVGEELCYDLLLDENMNPIESTPHPYMKFYLRTNREINEGDIIRFK